MIIVLSLVVVTIVIGLVLRSVVNASRDPGYTSLGTLKSAAPAKPSRTRKKTSPLPVAPKKQQTTDTDELRQKLLRKSMGDIATVDRLVEYERRLNPTGTLTIWLKAAVDRWEDDLDGRRRR